MVPRRRRGTPRGCPAPSRVCSARSRRGPPLRPQRCVPTGARAPLCEHGGPRHPPETVGAAYVRFILPGVLQTVRRCAGGLQTFSVKDLTVTILGAGLPGSLPRMLSPVVVAGMRPMARDRRGRRLRPERPTARGPAPAVVGPPAVRKRRLRARRLFVFFNFHIFTWSEECFD